MRKHARCQPKGGPDPTQGVRRDLLSLIHLFLKARLEWDQLVLNHSFALILKSLDTLADIRSTVQNACFLQKCPEDEVVLEDGYAWKQFCKLNDYYHELKAMLDTMTSLAFKIQELNEQFETLVEKSCKAHSIQRIFEGPIGLSWSLPRMSDHFISLSTHYLHSLQFHHSLYHVIVSQDTPLPEKQAAVSYWACQPLMYDKADLKDLLDAELPGSFNAPPSTPRKVTQKKL